MTQNQWKRPLGAEFYSGSPQINSLKEGVGDSTMCKTLALHVTDTSSLPGTPNSPLTMSSSDP